MFNAFYLVFYSVGIVFSYPLFKFIKYDKSWKIFQRFGDLSCSYYEEVNISDDFLTVKDSPKSPPWTVKDGFIYLGYRKKLIDRDVWEKPDCPEVADLKYNYRKSIATGIWEGGKYENPKVEKVEDYDIEACEEYENFILYGMIMNPVENTDNIDCIDNVLQSLGLEVSNKLILITKTGDQCQYGYMELEEHIISVGKV